MKNRKALREFVIRESNSSQNCTSYGRINKLIIYAFLVKSIIYIFLIYSKICSSSYRVKYWFTDGFGYKGQYLSTGQKPQEQSGTEGPCHSVGKRDTRY